MLVYFWLIKNTDKNRLSFNVQFWNKACGFFGVSKLQFWVDLLHSQRFAKDVKKILLTKQICKPFQFACGKYAVKSALQVESFFVSNSCKICKLKCFVSKICKKLLCQHIYKLKMLCQQKNCFVSKFTICLCSAILMLLCQQMHTSAFTKTRGAPNLEELGCADKRCS